MPQDPKQAETPKELMPEEKEPTEPQKTPDPLEEAEKTEQESEDLGGDSSEGGSQEYSRPEQDQSATTTDPEGQVPAPSTR